MNTFCAAFRFMKFSLSLTLLVAFFLSSCSEEPPPQRASSRRATRHPDRGISASWQPFNPNGPVRPQGAPGGGSPFNGCANSSEGRLSIRNSLSGKPHLVESPSPANTWTCRFLRNGSEGSLHGQNFSRPVIALTCPSAAAALTQVNLKNL